MLAQRWRLFSSYYSFNQAPVSLIRLGQDPLQTAHPGDCQHLGRNIAKGDVTVTLVSHAYPFDQQGEPCAVGPCNALEVAPLPRNSAALVTKEGTLVKSSEPSTT